MGHASDPGMGSTDRSGRASAGIRTLFSGSAAIIEILGQTGYDFVMIDTEHSPPNARVLEDLIRTAELAGLIPYVRVTSALNEVEVRLALEAGAEGLFLPQTVAAVNAGVEGTEFKRASPPAEHF
jgi:2-keto-3-deoxy-L-rhamnonate aldolase RhmA